MFAVQTPRTFFNRKETKHRKLSGVLESTVSKTSKYNVWVNLKQLGGTKLSKEINTNLTISHI